MVGSRNASIELLAKTDLVVKSGVTYGKEGEGEGEGGDGGEGGRTKADVQLPRSSPHTLEGLSPALDEVW